MGWSGTLLQKVMQPFVFGILATLFCEFILYGAWLLWSFYTLSRFSGRYEICRRDDAGHPVPTGGIVELSYRYGNLFLTRATNRQFERDWEGVLRLAKHGGHITGLGTYSHLHRDDTGVHHVMLSHSTGCLNVTADNTSHPHGRQNTKLVWRRKAASTGE